MTKNEFLLTLAIDSVDIWGRQGNVPNQISSGTYKDEIKQIYGVEWQQDAEYCETAIPMYGSADALFQRIQDDLEALLRKLREEQD